MSKFENLVKKEKKFILQTYSRYPVALKRGSGVYVWDFNNKKYLDFLSGVAVNNLGYNNLRIRSVINNPFNKLIHTSNLFYTNPQIKLAEKLSKLTNRGKVFFANSGAEVNEAAIKLARAYGNQFKKPRKKIITLKNSFHGRTLATVFATGQKKYQKPFKPKVGDYIYVEPNNIKKLKKAVSNKVSAIIIEVVQGEGGVNKLDKNFVHTVYFLCKKNKILFIIDEIQTGFGRTGKLFGFQHYQIVPDVITIAKAMANGFPMGAMVVKKEFADVLQPGMHASTFGGGALISSVAEQVLDIISKKSFLNHVQKMSKYLFEKLNKLKEDYPFIIEVRGIGLMAGICLNIDGTDIVKKALKQGLIINCVQKNIIRFLPPLIIQKNHIDEAIKKLNKVLQTV